MNITTNWFFWFKVVSGGVSLVLLIAIARLIIRIDFFSDKRDYGIRLLRDKNVQQKHLVDQWKYVLALIATQSPDAWKKAFVIADNLLHDVLKNTGLLGRTTQELLAQVGDDRISNSDALKRIRQDVLAMINGEREVEFDVVKECLREYRQAFRQMKALE